MWQNLTWLVRPGMSIDVEPRRDRATFGVCVRDVASLCMTSCPACRVTAASLSWVEHKEGAGGTPQGSGLSLTACGHHGVMAFGGTARAPHNQLYCLDPSAAAWQRWKPSGVRHARS